jgi:hypothetical protein
MLALRSEIMEPVFCGEQSRREQFNPKGTHLPFLCVENKFEVEDRNGQDNARVRDHERVCDKWVEWNPAWGPRQHAEFKVEEALRKAAAEQAKSLAAWQSSESLKNSTAASKAGAWVGGSIALVIGLLTLVSSITINCYNSSKPPVQVIVQQPPPTEPPAKHN